MPRARVSAAVGGVAAGQDSVASTVAKDFRSRVLWPQRLPRLPRWGGRSTCWDRRRSASFFSVATGEAYRYGSPLVRRCQANTASLRAMATRADKTERRYQTAGTAIALISGYGPSHPLYESETV